MSRTMRFDWLRILALSLLCMSTTGVQAQAPVQSASSQLPEDYPEKILFVGNSFTYYNDGLHMHYGNLLRAANLYDEGRNELRMMTYSGSGLWEHPAALRSAVTNDDWDAVVMHDYSNGPLTQWQRFVASSDKLAEIARGQGARPVLLMTWAYADQPEMTIQLAEAYTRRGKELAATVIPVGLAFAAASKILAINLYSPDLLRFEGGEPVYEKIVKHPSMAGTYLAACTVFATLTGRNPEGLIYTGGLDAEVARVLQRVAHTTVQSYQRNP